MASGVKSLKIEGRLRRADYVHNVVSAYRLAMKASGDPASFREALPQAKELLSKTCGRRWSLGFYTESSRRDLIKFDALGASGQLCGKVVSAGKSGFYVLASRRIHVGDVIRVQPRSGDEGPAITITKMSMDGHTVSRALKDEKVFIHSDKPVANEALVYKTGESVSDFTKRIEALPERKSSADLEIFLDRTGIEVRTQGMAWHKDLDLAEAGSHPVDEDTLQKEFSIVSTDDVAAGRMNVSVSGRPFLPASILKSLRKEFTLWFAENVSVDSIRADNERRLQDFLSHYHAMRMPDQPGPVRYAAIIPRGKRPRISPETVIVREIADSPSPHEELLLPFFIRENELPMIRKALDDFEKRGGKCVRISSLHHLKLMEAYPGLQIKTCMPLPVCNSIAAEELLAHGVSVVQAWLELGKNELEMLAVKSPLPLEQYRFGRPVLLATHARIPADGTLTDARGNVFRISRERDLTYLTGGQPMRLPHVRHFAAVLDDYRHADGSEQETEDFNFECGLS